MTRHPAPRHTSLPTRLFRLLALVAGLAAVAAGAALLAAPLGSLGRVEALRIGATPATLYLPRGPEPGPSVVIAHGFAGSQQLMQSFAIALAQGGYRAIIFDFPGHGQSAQPMDGGLEERARRNAQLEAALGEVVAYAEGRFGGPVGLLGHSMGSEVVARYAQSDPSIAATVGVSLVYEGVTPDSPRNLLALTGAWEPQLIPLALAVAPGGAPGVTSGSFEDGTARRAVLVPGAEHIGVLFSGTSMAESEAWFRAAMPPDPAPPAPDLAGIGYGTVGSRMPALGLMFVGAILLFWPLSALLQPIGPVAGRALPLGRWAWWGAVLVPALLTPLLLRFVPAQGLLPILVGGPLALFFLIYGLLTLAGLAVGRLARRRQPAPDERRPGVGERLGTWRRGVMMALAVALLVVGYVFLGFGLPAQLAVLNYFPPAPRLPVFLAVLAAMLPFFLADEALTRRPGAPRGAYAITKLCFLLSLVGAIALNPNELFFLTLIAPIFLLYFAVYGLFSGIVWRRTGTTLPGALANSAIFAWAVAAVFPLVS
jgi:pimeloyl-ACP methyl ester carboxylesterase